MADPESKYLVRRFSAPAKDSLDYAAGADWVRAVGLGFHDSRRSDDWVEKVLAMYTVDRREFTGAYVDGPVPGHALPATFPVATFGSMRKPLNVGFGRQLEAHLVTAVTVRGTHRRKGLLRRLMTDDLAAARADGVAIAALTASEGSIYGRFGFGVATFERTVTVDTGPRFRLAGQPEGSVELADPRVLLELGPGIFARVQRHTPGSIGRQEFYRQHSAGQFTREGGEDDALKAALHFDAAGKADGYVAYKFTGWDKKPYTVEIVDLVAGTDSAYLALWSFLGTLDLIEQVRWTEAPVDDPLAWALTDPRCVSSADVRDMLWLRVLDTASALAAREYSAEGKLLLKVTDSLGFASGTWVLDARADGAAATPAPAGASPELTLDVADLGSIYLGAVSPVTLAAAGRITEHARGAAVKAQRMFAVERAPHCLTHF